MRMVMEAGQSRHSPYKICPRPADPESGAGNSSNWNLNGWEWNPHTFKATRLNSGPSDRSRQLFPVGPENPSNVGFEEASPSVHVGDSVRGNDKRIVMDADEELDDDGKSLSLKLGGPVYSTKSVETKTGKKTKYVGYNPTGVVCQVEGCKADLSRTKDYLRRHKVCEIHSKASSVLIGGVMKRFCQQCSRFQELQEFDKEKRSCIRRLEGHNKRRRKTHPDPVATAEPVLNERDSNSLLISLLRILGNTQVNPQDQNRDQDLLTQLMRNFAGTSAEQSFAALMQQLKNEGTSTGTQSQLSLLTAPSGSGVAKASGSNSVVENSSNIQGSLMPPNEQDLMTLPSSSMMQNTNNTEGKKLVDIDLNRGAQDCMEDVQLSHDPNLANGYVDIIPKLGVKDPQKAPCSCAAAASDSIRSTPPSSSSSSGGPAQNESCTDRILIKLFEKTPEDMPSNLWAQIFVWLHKRPTDVESYIRPGCIILTIYLRLENSMWEELCNDLPSALKRLLGSSVDSFWRRGWICTKIRHSIAIAHDGEVIIGGSFPSRNHENCSIALIKPIAVTVSKRAKFSVKGFNLWGSSSRILCNMHGKCLVEQSCHNPIDGAKSVDITNLSVHCPIPDITGRGFVEVEDEGLRGNSFPFIVAEEEVCSEIRTLETAIDATNEDESPPKDEAMNFLHEMGWLLQRSNLIRRANHDHGRFPFERFRWLMNFAVENDWCAVVKKLLDILFDGVVDTEDHGSVNQVVFDLCLLHKAVRRNCRDMVELLLEYVVEECDQCFVFKPDEVGPLGLTPLHLAANNAGSEEVLDALTDDPGSVGLEAWNTAKDDMGLTPNDYASLKHHYSYINLIQSKLNGSRRKPYSPQIVLDMPQPIIVLPKTPTTLNTQCELCEHRKRVPYRTPRACLPYRPALASVLCVAALCVCVALLFRGSPDVIYIFRPFRWEMVKYGTV